MNWVVSLGTEYSGVVFRQSVLVVHFSVSSVFRWCRCRNYNGSIVLPWKQSLRVLWGPIVRLCHRKGRMGPWIRLNVLFRWGNVLCFDGLSLTLALTECVCLCFFILISDVRLTWRGARTAERTDNHGCLSSLFTECCLLCAISGHS